MNNNEIIPVGTIKIGKEIEKKDKCKFIWHSCIDCGKLRWVRLSVLKRGKCYHCVVCGNAKDKGGKPPRLTGKNHPNYRSGRYITKGKYKGYIMVYIPEDSFFRSMCGQRPYLPEHRLVMAKHLGRCLQSWEQVHHKNGIKTDNRIENLELTTNGQHHLSHHKGYVDGYQKGYNDAAKILWVLLRGINVK